MNPPDMEIGNARELLATFDLLLGIDAKTGTAFAESSTKCFVLGKQESAMRSLSQLAVLTILPVIGLFSAPAIADGSDFCLSGSTSQDSINCGARWVAADGTRLGQVPHPRDTPKTPYTGSAKIWSGSSGQYSAGEAHQRSRVWRSTAMGQRHAVTSGQAQIIRGGHNNSRLLGGYVHSSNQLVGGELHQPQIITSRARHFSGCEHGSQDRTYSSQQQFTGCFSYDEHGRAHPVPCPANVNVSENWSQGAHVSVWQGLDQRHTNIRHSYQDQHLLQNNMFFATLNGGVGSDGGVFYGGGGGYGYSSVGGSVLGQAPLLRFGTKRKGGGGGMNGKKGHGGKGKGGMMKSNHGGSSHGGGGGH